MTNAITGLLPAIVVEYLPESRECRVEIPGMTDGSGEKLIAQMMQALGDMTEKTEIEILPGDRVWLQFEEGDQRHPIIVGYRSKNTGNRLKWRRWHHENVEVLFDDVGQMRGPNGHVRMEGGGAKVIVNASKEVEVTAGSKITATVGGAKIEVTEISIRFSVGGSSLVLDGGSITAKAGAINLN